MATANHTAAPRQLAVVAAFLAAFGVYLAVPRAGRDSDDKSRSAEARAAAAAPSEAADGESFLAPLVRFVRMARSSYRDPEQLPQRLRELGFELEFLVALVPDPIDSRQGYRFDLALEALQRAIEAQDYLLDSWYLPWKLPSGKDAAGPGRAEPAHEWMPGTLLFRQQAKERTAATTLLVVFLVGETPTAGIQRVALTTSLDFIKASGSWKPTEPIRILGPMFSGTATSLALTLREWSKAQLRQAALPLALTALLGQPPPAVPLAPHGKPLFRVLTGSATGIPAEQFKKQARPADVCFAATVHSDQHVWDEMWTYLKAGRPRLRAALLVESDTAYGHRAVHRTARAPKNANKEKPVPVEDEVRILPFPLHVSQVRTVYNQETLARDATLPASSSASTKLPLPFEAEGAYRDIVPPLNRAITAATAEQTLTQILATIARENYRYVGLMATDTRDKLFLAGLVRDHCPDVQLFTIQSDLLLSHPSYRQYLKGTLVGSTYPLLFKNQSWTPPEPRFHTNRRLVPLSEDGDVGVYNATLALLGAEESMLEYTTPGYELVPLERKRRAPPIWISVIGERGPWPLKVVRTDNVEPPQPYVYRFDREVPQPQDEAAEDALRRRFALRFSGSWLLCLFIAAALTAAVMAAYVLARRGAEPGSSDWEIGAFFRPPDSLAMRRQHATYVFVCFASLAVLFGYLCTESASLLNPHFVAASLDVWRTRWNLATFGLTIVTFMLLVGLLGWHVWRAWGALGRTAGGARSWSGVTLVGGAGLFLVLLVVLVAWKSHAVRQQQPEEVLASFERIVNFEDGVSPVLPVFFLCALGCAWSLCHLKRLYLLNRFRTRNPFAEQPDVSPALENSALDRPTPGIASEEDRFGELLQKLQAVENSLLRTLQAPTWHLFYRPLALGAGACLAAGLGYLYHRALPSFEGPLFDTLVRLAFVAAVLGFLGALIAFVTLWVRLRRLLRRIVSLPMASAFDHLPPRISESFGRFFSSLRPRDSLSQIAVPLQQWQLLGQQYRALTRAAGDLPPDADPAFRSAWNDLGKLLQPVRAAHEDGQPVPAGTESDHLNETARGCVAVLRHFWPSRTVEDAFGQGDAAADRPFALYGLTLRPGAAEFLRDAEAFVAMRAVPFVGQFFVHLRNLMTFLTVAAVLLLLAIGSYPFQPQRLLLLWGWAAVLSALFVVINFFLQSDRDELLSRISRTRPNAVTLDWTLLSNLFKFVVPLALLLLVQVPVVGDWLSYVLAPLIRALR